MKLLTKQLDLSMPDNSLTLINCGSKFSGIKKANNGQWQGKLDLSVSRLGQMAIQKWPDIEQRMGANVLNAMFNARTNLASDNYDFLLYHNPDRPKLGLFQTYNAEGKVDRRIIKLAVRMLTMLCTIHKLDDSPTQVVLMELPDWPNQTELISLYEELPNRAMIHGVEQIATPITAYHAMAIPLLPREYNGVDTITYGNYYTE